MEHRYSRPDHRNGNNETLAAKLRRLEMLYERLEGRVESLETTGGMPGPTGPQGERGATGATGPTGPAG